MNGWTLLREGVVEGFRVRWAKGDELAACEARVGAQLLLCDDLVSGLGVVADNLSRKRAILVERP